MTPELHKKAFFLLLGLLFILSACSNNSRRPASAVAAPQTGWIQKSDLSKGIFFALATDPTNPSVAYAASSTISLYKTTDGGTTWAPANNGLPFQPILSLFVDPIDPSTLYAAVAGGGIFVTNDGAGTWRSLNQGLTQTDLHAVVSNLHAPPSGLQITSGDTTNSLKWNAVPHASAYHLYFSACASPCATPPLFDSSWQRIDVTDPTQLQYDHTGLTDGTAYYYVITATVGGGESPVSSEVSAVPGPKSDSSAAAPYPDGVGATAGDLQNVVRWNSVNGAASYDVYRSTSPGVPTTGVGVAPVKAGITGLSYPDILVKNGTAYYYVVTATTSGNESVPSAEVSATPQQMTSLYIGTSAGVWASGPSGEFRTLVNGSGPNGLAAPDGLDIRALLIDPATSAKNPPTLYAGTRGGVYRTTDGGQNWFPNNAGLNQPAVLSLALDAAHGALYAGTAAGIYKGTVDGSAPWAFLGNGTLAVTALAIDPVDPQTVYATTATNGILKSVDGGANWAAINSGLTVLDLRSIQVDPADRSLLYAGGLGLLFKSADGGNNWAPIDLGSLENIANPLLTSEVKTLVAAPAAGSILYAGGSAGVYKSADQGKGWSAASIQLSSREIVALAPHPTQPAVLYAAASGDGIYKSLNGGGDWRAENGPPDNPPNPSQQVSKFVTSLVIDPGQPTRLYAGTSGEAVFRGTEGPDGHLSWCQLLSGLTSPGILSLTLVPGNPTVVYAGTFENGIFKWTDDGSNTCPASNAWTPASADLSDKSVFALAVHPQLSSVLFAGTSDGFYKSGDGGAHWLPIGDLQGEDIHTISFDSAPSNPVLYVGSSSGVFKSVDQGNRWIHLDDGMTSPVFSVLVDPGENNVVYAGTVAGGVYRRVD